MYHFKRSLKHIYFQSNGKYAYEFEKQWIYGLEWYMYHLLLRTGRLSVVEITTVTITQAEKRSQSREWYVYHFKRRALKSIFLSLW